MRQVTGGACPSAPAEGGWDLRAHTRKACSSRAEMRGQSGNELTQIPDDDYTAIWRGLMRRLGRIPEYRRMFEQAYPGKRFNDMTFVYASNAIGGFLVVKLTLNNSPWDQFLAGRDKALSAQQLVV
jgi:cytochrome c peroxidase